MADHLNDPHEIHGRKKRISGGRKMNKKRILYVLCFLLIISTISIPATDISAATNKNKKAHTAFKRELPKLKKEYGGLYGGLAYAYVDVDGDGIDELIIEPGYGYYFQGIYKYRSGRVKRVCAIGQGPFKRYYPKKKIVFSQKTGHMGVLTDNYFKWSNGTYKIVASVVRIYSGDYGQAPDTVTYLINNKKTTKKKYQSYTKKLLKGDKGKAFSNIKWKQY